MAKKEFFRQPKISEILGGKKELKVHQRLTLVEIINACTPGFALHLTRPVLPRYYDDARNFLKFGNEAMVGNEIWIPPRQAIATALHYAKPPFGSIAVRSRVDGVTVTRTMLDTCIQGMKLYVYSLNNEPIIVSGPSRSKEDIREMGADFDVSVPSEEIGKERHNVSFSNVPMYETYNKKWLWTDLGAACDCDFTRWWKPRMYSGERLFCQHMVAAYYAVASLCAKKQLLDDQIPEDMNVPKWAIPFPIFSEEAIGFGNKMRRQVIVDKSGRRLPLNSSERSLLFGEYIFKQTPKTALYHAGKKEVEFDW